MQSTNSQQQQIVKSLGIQQQQAIKSMPTALQQYYIQTVQKLNIREQFFNDMWLQSHDLVSKCMLLVFGMPTDVILYLQQWADDITKILTPDQMYCSIRSPFGKEMLNKINEIAHNSYQNSSEINSFEICPAYVGTLYPQYIAFQLLHELINEVRESRQICYHQFNGVKGCLKGDKCKYSHKSSLEQLSIDFICCVIEDLKRGNQPNPVCKNGMLCVYKDQGCHFQHLNNESTGKINYSRSRNVNSVQTADIIKWELVNSPMNESDMQSFDSPNE